MKKRSIRWIAVAAIFGGVVASSPNSPVKADTFRPLPSPPVVEITDYPDSVQAGGTETIVPLRDRSDQVLEVSATVTTNATVNDIATVTMCLWNDVGVGTALGTTPPATHDSVDPCGSDSTAANSVQMVWTEDTVVTNGSDVVTSAGFSLLGTSNHQNASSTVVTGSSGSTTYIKTDQSLFLTFKFKVSSALLAGSDWNVRVSAQIPDSVCDDPGTTPAVELCTTYGASGGFTTADLEGSDEETTGMVVRYYGEVHTGDADATSSNNYDYLKTGQTSGEEVFSSFDYLTNGMSNLTVEGTAFSRTGGPSGELALVATAPVEDEVQLVCYDSAGASAAGDKVSVVTGTPEPLTHDRNPTVETETSGSITCTLQYGGGASRALSEYSNVVTVGIKAAS